MARTDNRIELLCLAIEQSNLLGYAERAGAGEILKRILAAVANGDYGPELDRDLDALDDAMAMSGLGPVTDADRGTYRRVPDSKTSHPVVDVWICPAVRPCGRAQPAGGSAPAPACAATGQRLRLLRLAT
jgi:hypothetical protein